MRVEERNLLCILLVVFQILELEPRSHPQHGSCVGLFRVRAIADGRVKAECEMRRILRLGSIVPVDLDVVGRCILS